MSIRLTNKGRITYLISTSKRSVTLKLSDMEEVERLILDPVPIVWCCEGVYLYVSKDRMMNAARELRNKVKRQSYFEHKLELTFEAHNTDDIQNEIGQIIHALYVALHQPRIAGGK